MGVLDFIFGKPDKLKKVPTGTKQQEAFGSNILQQAMNMSQPGGGYNLAQNYFQNLLQPGQEGFNQFSEPYLQQFQEQIAPRIAEQFAGAGALSSSGFGQALGGAGAGLQAQLAQLFSSLQQQAAGAETNQYNQLAQTGLNYQPFAYEKKQGSGGFLGPLATGLGMSLGGPLGGLAAGGISSLFKPQSQSSGLGGFAPMAAMMGYR